MNRQLSIEHPVLRPSRYQPDNAAEFNPGARWLMQTGAVGGDARRPRVAAFGDARDRLSCASRGRPSGSVLLTGG